MEKITWTQCWFMIRARINDIEFRGALYRIYLQVLHDADVRRVLIHVRAVQRIQAGQVPAPDRLVVQVAVGRIGRVLPPQAVLHVQRDEGLEVEVVDRVLEAFQCSGEAGADGVMVHGFIGADALLSAVHAAGDVKLFLVTQMTNPGGLDFTAQFTDEFAAMARTFGLAGVQAPGVILADLTMGADGAVNHGQFVSCVASLLNRLKNEGAITGKEKGAIQSCAAKSKFEQSFPGGSSRRRIRSRSPATSQLRYPAFAPGRAFASVVFPTCRGPATKVIFSRRSWRTGGTRYRGLAGMGQVYGGIRPESKTLTCIFDLG